MRYGRPRRLQGFNDIGIHRYFVTCCVAERRAAFTSDDRVHCVREQILRTCADRQFEETASVFMPGHLHLLIAGKTNDAAFVPFMTLVRQRTAVAYRKLTREFLWQRGYFDRVLRPSEDPTQFVRYIRKNPVRAGLVNAPEEYPFTFNGTDILT